MSTYEPGTVAVATVRGVPNVRVMRCGPKQPFWMSPEYEGDDQGSDRQWRMHSDREVTDVRPLVVLDLAQIDEIAATTWHEVTGNLLRTDSPTAICIADQIEAQTKPPRIPEPGLWGVVEAHPQARTGRPVHFLRDSEHEDAPWRSIADGSAWEWDSLVDPVLVRDGIEERA